VHVDAASGLSKALPQMPTKRSLLIAPYLGGHATTTMVLAIDTTQHYTLIRPFPSRMLSPHDDNQPPTFCALLR
jgi:hypothetical protein